MAELSKTARASMGKQVKEVHVETIEEAIKAIRDNRAVGLFIGDMSRVDKLLAALDEESQKLLDVSSAYDAVTAKVSELQDQVVSASKQITHLQDQLDEITPGEPEAISEQTIEPTTVMATIPAQEHDEHHLIDFGHGNTHSHHEGA